jgi:hypothetical protein
MTRACKDVFTPAPSATHLLMLNLRGTPYPWMKLDIAVVGIHLRRAIILIPTFVSSITRDENTVDCGQKSIAHFVAGPAETTDFSQIFADFAHPSA